MLRSIATYANELADARADGNTADGSATGEDESDDLPDSVPAKATITEKEINGNRYYYWQWRDGDSIKSKYKGPVDSSG